VIEVESEVGCGATFTIWLPLNTEGGVNGEADNEQPALATGTEHILLADDEELIQQFSKEMLELAGYRVTTVTNGQEALDLFQQDPTAFDLILTDMTMPKMSGLDLARRAMAIRPGMPVILCSGYNDQVSKDGALSAGVKEYLIKPVAGLKLCSVIREVLDGRVQETG
jgi:CheY-like chemotaxis protein